MWSFRRLRSSKMSWHQRKYSSTPDPSSRFRIHETTHSKRQAATSLRKTTRRFKIQIWSMVQVLEKKSQSDFWFTSPATKGTLMTPLPSRRASTKNTTWLHRQVLLLNLKEDFNKEGGARTSTVDFYKRSNSMAKTGKVSRCMSSLGLAHRHDPTPRSSSWSSTAKRSIFRLFSTTSTSTTLQIWLQIF